MQNAFLDRILRKALKSVNSFMRKIDCLEYPKSRIVTTRKRWMKQVDAFDLLSLYKQSLF